MHTAEVCLSIHLSVYFNIDNNKEILIEVGIEDIHKIIQANLVLVHTGPTPLWLYFARSCTQTLSIFSKINNHIKTGTQHKT